MSLIWNLGPNADKRRELYPPRGEYMNPVTYTLITLTMSIGMGKLTKANAAEFYARATLSDKLYGPLLGNEDGSPRAITPEDVLAHVGLTTNVIDEARGPWLKRILSDQLSDSAWQFNRAAEAAEKAVKADSVPADN